MNNWKVIFATVVIFGAGVITGGLLVNYVDHSHSRQMRHAVVVPPLTSPVTNALPRLAELPKPSKQDILSKQFTAQLDDYLRLSPAQHAAIAKIVAEGQEQNRTISTNAAAQIRIVMQEVRQSIRAQLTPEQRKPFEDLLKQHAPKSTFAERLEQIRQREALRLGTNAPPGSEGLTPEAQLLLLESNRLNALSKAPPFLPPPPFVATNLPATGP